MTQLPRIAFAANRNIGVEALRLLLKHDIEPVALIVPKGKQVDGAVGKMLQLLSRVPTLHGKVFREQDGVKQLETLDIDYLLSIHFPYIIPRSVLDIPRIGTLNLHPAFLPFNRGWHTPSWAILDQTPYGATLHWVDEGMDTGDIALQHQVEVMDSETADVLYSRVLQAEIDVLSEAIPLLKSRALPRVPQTGQGTEHMKSDLGRVRRLNLDERLPVGEVLRRIRALTTNQKEEAAWFELNGERYLVQLSIQRDTSKQNPPLKIFRAA